MRLTATLLLCLLSGPAMAASCDGWTASMEEDEGGPRMMAIVCSGSGDNEQTLIVQCGGTGDLNLRYLPAPSSKYPPGEDPGNFEAELKFTLGKDTFLHKGRYEAMDGAMAFYVPMKGPLVEAMTTNERVLLSDTDGKLAGVTFTLKNSGKALREVMKTCGG